MFQNNRSTGVTVILKMLFSFFIFILFDRFFLMLPMPSAFLYEAFVLVSI